MKIRLFCALLVLMFSASFASAEEKASRVIAIARFQNASFNRGLDYLSTMVPEALTSRLSSLSGITVVERDQFSRIVEEKKLALSGFGNAEDMAVIGRELNADAIIIGSFTVVGKFVRIDARLVDVKEVKVLDSWSVSSEIGFDMENRLSGLAQKVRFSITGEPYATLAIASPAGAQAILDGQLIGSIPLDDRLVADGAHTLLIGKSGFENLTASFYATNGQRLNLDYTLKREPRAFQFSGGLAVSAFQAGLDSGLASASPVGIDYIDLEVQLKGIAVHSSFGGLDIQYSMPVSVPVDQTVTNLLLLHMYEISAGLRYYPITGFFTPWMGAGVSIQNLSLDLKQTNALTIPDQIRFAPLAEAGLKVNLFDDHLSLILTAVFKLPPGYELFTRDFSIFGDLKDTPVVKSSEWLDLKIGLCYNLF